MDKDNLKQVFGLHIKEVNDEEKSIRFIFSTNDEDRHGDVVDQKGWDLKQYKENPVVLFAHDHWQPAVGQTTEFGLNGEGQLEGVIKFAVEEYDFAETLYKLYKGKFMRAVSVGFRNKRFEVDQENDRFILLENELHEVSLVNVPANARALAKSAGIDMSPIDKFVKEAKEKSQLKLKEKDIDSIANKVSKGIQDTINNGLITTTKEVETPKKKDEKKEKKITTKQINQAVRKLLREKKQRT